MRRLLVTGATGFVGRRFVDRARHHHAVTATARGRRPDDLPEDVTWVSADLTRDQPVETLGGPWDGIAHLAAESVPASFTSRQPVFDSLGMTLNALRYARGARFLLVSSCLVYGPGSRAKSENDPVAYGGGYALAKILSEAAVLSASDVEGVVARPFNHIGAGMRQGLAIPSIAARIDAAASGAPIAMHGMNSSRDFLDVDDIVDAYLAILAMDRLDHRIFNVCSGVERSMEDIVRSIAIAADKVIGPVEFAQAPSSEDDRDILVGNPERLMQATGWRPRITLSQSAARMLEAMDRPYPLASGSAVETG